MAATANKYSQQADCTVVNGERKILALIPLALQEYGNAARFKQLFYLDDVEFCKDFQGNNCVRGVVQQGSTNAAMHAGKRRGVLMRRKDVADGVWQSYNLLNDGGLNTFAFCKFADNDPVVVQFANYIRVITSLASSYYALTQSFKISVNNVTKGWTKEVTIPTGQQGNVLPAKQQLSPLSVVLQNIDGIDEGDQLLLTISSVNEEGQYTNPNPLSIRANAPVYLTVVYRFDTLPGPDVVPWSGEPYVVVLDRSRWLSDNTFGVLFAEQESVVIANAGAPIKGAQGDLTDITDSFFSNNLPAGIYYGIPTTFAGSEFKFVGVFDSGGDTLAWYNERYAPASGFQVKIMLTYILQSGAYMITAEAQISGDVPSEGISITTKVLPKEGPSFEDPGAEFTRANITQAGSYNLGSFAVAQSVASAYRTATSCTPAASKVHETELNF